MTEPTSLEELKNQYNIFKEKYNLPEFTELNKLFDIEDIDIETEFLLRKIRRIISDRIAGYLRYIDAFSNPSNVPIFFLKIIKKLESKDREILGEIYDKLGNFEIQLISLDLDYSEEKEADFIKNIYKIFNEEIKSDFLKIVEKLKNSKEIIKKINGSYLG